ESATWDDDRHVWSVRLDDGTVEECHALVSAVGFLNVPRYPDWPGLSTFQGPKFHTARWEHEHDLAGKVVAVVGTGSSATQVVPAIQPSVEHLYLFQREPGWVLPKGERDFTEEEQVALAKRWPGRRERWRQRWMLEKNLWNGALWRPGTKTNSEREALCRRYIERAVDVIVIATGFQTTNYLARMEVVGRDGRILRDHWGDEPRAYLGITVPGFPNFFILYGPGTNGGELVMTLESQAEYAVRAARRMIRERVTAIDGEWVDAASDDGLEVINPATEEAIGSVPQGSVADVDRAVAAARKAFEDGTWRRMSPRQRSDALLRFMQTIADRKAELVDLIIAEAGAARWVAEGLQFDTGFKYAQWFAERTASFPFQDPLPPQVSARGLGQGVILKEPAGVVAAITPFNFPL